MNLTRKYKIHRLTPCLNVEELEIVTFIENKIKGLKPIKKEEYTQYTYYVNSDDETILKQDYINDRLMVKYNGFWVVLQNKYLLKYTEAQDIIRYMVLMHLKFDTSTPTERHYTFYLDLYLSKFRTTTPIIKQ